MSESCWLLPKSVASSVYIFQHRKCLEGQRRGACENTAHQAAVAGGESRRQPEIVIILVLLNSLVNRF